jgi:predicted ATPase with chaperone activity
MTSSVSAPTQWQTRAGGAPPVPRTAEALGLPEDIIFGLLLKTMHRSGPQLGMTLSERLAIPFPLIDDHLLNLQQRMLVEVRGSSGHGRTAYTFDITEAGKERAEGYLSRNRYVGPAPVPLDTYSAWVERQSVSRIRVEPSAVRSALQDLILPEATVESLGPAINSGRSIFLYGPPGNGKTAIAERLPRLMGDFIYVPYAVLVDGHIVVLHDPVHHVEAATNPESAASGDAMSKILKSLEFDPRFAKVRRPAVMVGGELTLDQLDLQMDRESLTHRAPFQMKANGGLLIIDDFGRQRMRPEELLNRWIVPLERRIDFLTLQSGTKFPIPFDALLVFATNLDPESLVEEAFLRRIQYKAAVPDPDRPSWERIMHQLCERRDVRLPPGAIDWVYDYVYGEMGIPPRACHPRDIVDHVEDRALYLGVEPALVPELLEPACTSYFSVFAHAYRMNTKGEIE